MAARARSQRGIDTRGTGGKRGFTFHLNGMMSGVQRQGDGTAAQLPRPNINTLPFQTHQFKGTRSSSACFSSALCLHSPPRCHNCFAYVPAHGWYMESASWARTCSQLRLRLLVFVRLCVCVVWARGRALIKRRLLIVMALAVVSRCLLLVESWLMRLSCALVLLPKWRKRKQQQVQLGTFGQHRSSP